MSNTPDIIGLWLKCSTLWWISFNLNQQIGHLFYRSRLLKIKLFGAGVESTRGMIFKVCCVCIKDN
jgi:hypothetical protein